MRRKGSTRRRGAWGDGGGTCGEGGGVAGGDWALLLREVDLDQEILI